MTGPNPDAELDEALGIDELPPAQPTAEQHERARRIVAAHRRHGDEEELRYGIARALADAERRGAARVLAEHAAAGTGLPGPPPVADR